MATRRTSFKTFSSFSSSGGPPFNRATGRGLQWMPRMVRTIAYPRREEARRERSLADAEGD